MSKHTPGPWAFEIANSRRYDSITGEPKDWTSCCLKALEGDQHIGVISTHADNYKANAVLIAEAPEMLAGITDVLNACIDGKVSNEEKFRAAIQRINASFARATAGQDATREAV